MTTEPTVPVEDPEGELEKALIAEFLRTRGVDSVVLHSMPHEDAKALLAEASTYAANKLAEVEARAHFVHELHGEESR